MKEGDLLLLILIVVVIIVGLMVVSAIDRNTHTQAYDALTDEQKRAYGAELAQRAELAAHQARIANKRQLNQKIFELDYGNLSGWQSNDSISQSASVTNMARRSGIHISGGESIRSIKRTREYLEDNNLLDRFRSSVAQGLDDSKIAKKMSRLQWGNWRMRYSEEDIAYMRTNVR